MAQVKFKDLNWVLKIGIIGGWVTFLVWAASFLVGFMIGMLGG